MTRRSTLLILFLSALVILSFVGTSIGHFAQAASAQSTHVSGAITSDTTWTAANNPYQIDSSVTVAAGATLTIQPGVQVTGVSTTDSMIQVAGKLIANGTAAAPITFVWNSNGTYVAGIHFQNSASSSSSISYADLSGAQDGAIIDYPAPVLDHVSIHDNLNLGIDAVVSSTGGSPTSLQITNSSFLRNGTSVSVDVGNGSLTITNSRISDGVDPSDAAVYLTNVTAAYVHLHQNDIFNNPWFSVLLVPDSVNRSNLQLDATNNFWGYTDAPTIQKQIYDCHYDATSSMAPCVNFQNPLPSAVTSSQGTDTPIAVTSTATGTASPTPTRTPTPSGTGTPSPTLTPTPMSTRTAIPTTTGTVTAGPTSSPTATMVVFTVTTATPTRTVTATSAATPTDAASPTATVTQTSVPTATRTPTPTPGTQRFFTIDKVEVVHRVGGHSIATQTLKVGESATFNLLYHPVISNTLPDGTMTITKNGHLWHSYHMLIDVAVRSGHVEATYHASVSFKRGAPTGKLFVHFKLVLASAVAKRDRKFFVNP